MPGNPRDRQEEEAELQAWQAWAFAELDGDKPLTDAEMRSELVSDWNAEHERAEAERAARQQAETVLAQVRAAGEIREAVIRHETARREQAERDLALGEDAYRGVLAEERATLLKRAEQAERERDLAQAHDRQPYPTAWAYEKVCAARDRWNEIAREQKRELETVKSQLTASEQARAKAEQERNALQARIGDLADGPAPQHAAMDGEGL